MRNPGGPATTNCPNESRLAVPVSNALGIPDRYERLCRQRKTGLAGVASGKRSRGFDLAGITHPDSLVLIH